MKRSFIFLSSLLLVTMVLSACKKEDKRRPDVEELQIDGAQSGVEVLAGEPASFRVLVEDNMELAQIKLRVQPVGLANVDNEGEWIQSFVYDVDGLEFNLTENIIIPQQARGSYKVTATALDRQGLESEPVSLEFKIINFITPNLLFGGSIPDPEEDNRTVTIAIGETVNLVYSAEDSDGIAAVSYSFTAEGQATVEEELAPDGEPLFGFSTGPILLNPSEAATYIFKVSATDNTGLTSEAVHNIVVE